jgi:hypothetical protein
MAKKQNALTQPETAADLERTRSMPCDTVTAVCNMQRAG